MNTTKQPSNRSQSKGESPTGGRGLKVLLVEDYATLRNAIVKILESLHLEVIETKNGVEALQVLDNQSVDMVFTDLVMPEMDGFELCEEIRRRPALRKLPIIVVSTHRDATYVIQALRCGADDYLNKPFSASLAQRVIERTMSHV